MTPPCPECGKPCRLRLTRPGGFAATCGAPDCVTALVQRTRTASSVPADPAPPLPRRTASDDYCPVCGRTGSHWAGCPGPDAPLRPLSADERTLLRCLDRAHATLDRKADTYTRRTP